MGEPVAHLTLNNKNVFETVQKTSANVRYEIKTFGKKCHVKSGIITVECYCNNKYNILQSYVVTQKTLGYCPLYVKSRS